MVEREQEIAKLTDRLAGRGKHSIRKHPSGLRKLVRGSLGDIRELLSSKHAIPAIVRQELTKHVEVITLLPDGKDSVRYKGNWKILGPGYSECAEGQS